MITSNRSLVTEFILVGFSNHPHLQVLLFLLFLGVYAITLIGNLLIVLVTSIDDALHSPMYFFLRNLASLDLSFTFVVTPKMLIHLLVENKTISVASCATQLYFFFCFGTAQCCLLAAMSYDRYVAICSPLRYPHIITRRACWQLAGASWCVGFPVAMVPTVWLFSLPFCGPSVIDHFFCDTSALLELTCADTSLFEIESLSATVLFIVFPFLLILASYTRIITTILRMPSEEGRHKAFSTCSSHLVVVTLSYSTAISIYFQPKSSYSPDTKKLLSLSNSVVTPMLNPIIYCLRNKEVKGALQRMLGRKLFLQQM